MTPPKRFAIFMKVLRATGWQALRSVGKAIDRAVRRELEPKQLVIVDRSLRLWRRQSEPARYFVRFYGLNGADDFEVTPEDVRCVAAMMKDYLAEPSGYQFASPTGYFYVSPLSNGRTRFEISTEFRGLGVAIVSTGSLHAFLKELRNLTVSAN